MLVEPSPPLPELRALAARPGGLAAVEGFTVGKAGVGSIRWLGAVDVAGLDLDRLVRFGERTVHVYGDPSVPKPPVGTSLNTAAVRARGISPLLHLPPRARIRSDSLLAAPAAPQEITLVGIFPREGRDPAKLLRLLQTRPGTSFVSYDAETGTWRFQVDHF